MRSAKLLAFLPLLLIPACAAEEAEEADSTEGAIETEVGAAARQALKDVEPGAYASADAMLVVRENLIGGYDATLVFDIAHRGTSTQTIDDSGGLAVNGPRAYFNGACKMNLKVENGGDKITLTPVTLTDTREWCYDVKLSLQRQVPTMLEGSYDCKNDDNRRSVVTISAATTSSAKIAIVDSQTGAKLDLAGRFTHPANELSATSTDPASQKKVVHHLRWTRAKTLVHSVDGVASKCVPSAVPAK